MDRYVVLLHFLEQQHPSTGHRRRRWATGEGRGLDGAWWRILPNHQIRWGPREASHHTSLVQVGGIPHLGVRNGHARPHILGTSTCLHGRPRGRRYFQYPGRTDRGWFHCGRLVAYDLLIKTLWEHPRLVSLVGGGLLTGTAYGLTQLLSARAAYIHVGAIIGTIMAANVLFVIIPNHGSWSTPC